MKSNLLWKKNFHLHFYKKFFSFFFFWVVFGNRTVAMLRHVVCNEAGNDVCLWGERRVFVGCLTMEGPESVL